jgi:hypothetical protein
MLMVAVVIAMALMATPPRSELMPGTIELHR